MDSGGDEDGQNPKSVYPRIPGCRQVGKQYCQVQAEVVRAHGEERWRTSGETSARSEGSRTKTARETKDKVAGLRQSRHGSPWNDVRPSTGPRGMGTKTGSSDLIHMRQARRKMMKTKGIVKIKLYQITLHAILYL